MRTGVLNHDGLHTLKQCQCPNIDLDPEAVVSRGLQHNFPATRLPKLPILYIQRLPQPLSNSGYGIQLEVYGNRRQQCRQCLLVTYVLLLLKVLELQISKDWRMSNATLFIQHALMIRQTVQR
jgi:hypothetical protein